MTDYRIKSTMVNGPPLDSGASGQSSWKWMDTQDYIADETEFILKPDQGIEIFGFIPIGRVDYMPGPSIYLN